MEIVVSSPGSPGTTFTDNVKSQIVVIHDVLSDTKNFENAGELRAFLEEKYGYKQAYLRNIMAFLQNCGIVNYQRNTSFANDQFFTNIGYAYVDILKCLSVVEKEADSDEKKMVMKALKNIEEAIYFQCLIIMMKNKECNYAQDFFDVLRFADIYKSIDSTEYLLIQYARDKNPTSFLTDIKDIVTGYRDGSIDIQVKTKTKNDSQGDAKSVNSFPYVHGNFSKAGIFYKGLDNRFYINETRRLEIDSAIKELNVVWQSLAVNQ